MGDSKKAEKGVLKLVHPGRHVEIHTKPITVVEVMSKNPRHSVTRPDFFKFPYIVVRPESVLYPGQVFYIVPNSTIHKMLNSKSKFQNNNTPTKNQSPKLSVDSANCNSPRKNQSQKVTVQSAYCNTPRKNQPPKLTVHPAYYSTLRKTRSPKLNVHSEYKNTPRKNHSPKLIVHSAYYNTPGKNQSPKLSVDSSYHNTTRKTRSPKVNVDARSERRGFHGSYLEAWPMMGNNRNSYLDYRKSIGEESTVEDISVCRNKNYRNKSSKAAGANYNFTVQFHEQVNGIKSCLKKGSVRTSRSQRVAFASPIVTTFG